MGSTKKTEKTGTTAPTSTPGPKGTGGGTAVLEQGTTSSADPIAPPAPSAEYAAFNAKMERALGPRTTDDVEFLATAQRKLDELLEQITRMQRDADAYKSLLDHFGSAGR